MVKRVQHVRHTTASANAFTGQEGELTFDTTTGELRAHDGATAGGKRVLHKSQNDALYQPLAAKLTSLVDAASAADKLPYFSGDNAFSLVDFASLARSLIGSATEKAMRDVLGLTTGGELTVATGAITVTDRFHVVDTESDAASDDLVTITATNMNVGDIITLVAASDARRVYLTTAGNIYCPSLLRVNRPLRLWWDGTKWRPCDRYVLLDEKEASASASLEFVKGLGESSIRDTIFNIRYLTPATQGYFKLRTSVDAGANWDQGSGDYHSSRYGLGVGGSGLDSSSATETAFALHSYDIGTTGKLSGNLTLSDPSLSAAQLMYGEVMFAGIDTGPTARSTRQSIGCQFYGAAAAITGIQFLNNGGNISAGFIACFGEVDF